MKKKTNVYLIIALFIIILLVLLGKTIKEGMNIITSKCIGGYLKEVNDKTLCCPKKIPWGGYCAEKYSDKPYRCGKQRYDMCQTNDTIDATIYQETNPIVSECNGVIKTTNYKQVCCPTNKPNARFCIKEYPSNPYRCSALTRNVCNQSNVEAKMYVPSNTSLVTSTVAPSITSTLTSTVTSTIASS